MLHERQGLSPPSSPARRHFLGIAAAAARKLSMMSVGSSILFGLDGRQAAANERREPWYGFRHEHGHDFRHGSFDKTGAGTGTRSGDGAGSRSGPGSGGQSKSAATSGSGSSSGVASGSSSGSGAGSVTGSGAASGAGTSSGSGTGSGSSYWSEREPGATAGSASGSRTDYTTVRCFGRGTAILTADGEIPVENLAVGMSVVTMDGPKPIKWIGRQTIRRSGSATWHPRVLPVRVSRQAIDDQTPRRDVCLSQEHALFIDGNLIPVKYLVNGHSISWDETALTADLLEYFHVELDTHGVIFADGMPTETFLYLGGAIAWDNLDEYRDLYGEHTVMSPVAPTHSYDGGFAELRGLLRLAASHIIDVRDPIQIAYDRLAARALAQAA
jgi:hypothetical protein